MLQKVMTNRYIVIIQLHIMNLNGMEHQLKMIFQQISGVVKFLGQSDAGIYIFQALLIGAGVQVIAPDQKFHFHAQGVNLIRGAGKGADFFGQSNQLFSAGGAEQIVICGVLTGEECGVDFMLYRVKSP